MSLKSMELKLYDTLTREKRVFAPIDPARVRMYVCGPTVYDFAHIGNARPVIVFDVLFRLLRHLYGAEHVTYVRNITDVDDKINARAAERGISIRELTEADLQELQGGRRGARLPAADGRAARDRAYRGDEGADRAAGRVRQRLCRRGARAVQRAVDEGLRQAVQSSARRDDRRRPRRCRALQARRRWTSCCGSRRSRGEPSWPSPCGHRDAGPAGLAHRMLGDVVEASRRDLRHPRRRHRSRVPAPRERDRAIVLRVPRQR